ncbi:hypothetical protein [Methanolapillus millepedarum]|uniref:Uncharacterized protein n=1 Tax=Methanolapillus millepedarum TaxID=3028296 RepID=A0AA96VF44_9EURY|nr:hypothetical protein MsAc7_10090 [Methanosarcinaceae archaeon Ac7]
MALKEFPPIEKKSSDLISVLKNFDKFAKQLQNRYNQRLSHEFNDEHDALHAILRLFFQDVHAEDYVPENAGSKSVVDFYIPSIKTIIEVKYPRENFKDNKIGDDLLIDIGRYKARKDSDHLILFIFDKSGVLRNPYGLIGDLEKLATYEMSVKVVISPE